MSFWVSPLNRLKRSTTAARASALRRKADRSRVSYAVETHTNGDTARPALIARWLCFSFEFKRLRPSRKQMHEIFPRHLIGRNTSPFRLDRIPGPTAPAPMPQVRRHHLCATYIFRVGNCRRSAVLSELGRKTSPCGSETVTGRVCPAYWVGKCHCSHVPGTLGRKGSLFACARCIGSKNVTVRMCPAYWVGRCHHSRRATQHAASGSVTDRAWPDIGSENVTFNGH